MLWIGLIVIALVLIALRQSIPIVLISIAVFVHFAWLDGEVTYIIEDIWNAVDNPLLLSIPMFLLAGALMSHGTIASRLINIVRASTQWMPGGLALATILSCSIFAAISGSSTVTMLTMGAILFPALVQAGYSKQFSLGALTSAGTLGIIIPPSIPLIVFGIVNEQSVVDLFYAGIIPGVLLTGALGLYSVLRNRHLPAVKFDGTAFLSTLKEGVWALFLPVIMLGGIYSGFFSPTESAAVAVAYALVVEVFIHRDLNAKQIYHVFAETAKLLGTLIPIIAVIISLNQVLTVLEVHETVANWVVGIVDNKIMFLIAINILLLIVGCFIDPISAILILSPLLLRPAIELGVDPIHFAIIMVINLEIGLLTPPVGLNLIVATTAFRERFSLVVKGVIPFILVMAAVLLVVTFVPQLSVMLIR